MITAKLSDVWGLKTMLLACGAIFLIFSMACGAAQTMTQLYVNPNLNVTTELTIQDRLPCIPRHRWLWPVLAHLRLDPKAYCP
jgi:MFS family permease